jgi:hypothetical protein
MAKTNLIYVIYRYPTKLEIYYALHLLCSLMNKVSNLIPEA